MLDIHTKAVSLIGSIVIVLKLNTLIMKYCYIPSKTLCANTVSTLLLWDIKKMLANRKLVKMQPTFSSRASAVSFVYASLMFTLHACQFKSGYLFALPLA